MARYALPPHNHDAGFENEREHRGRSAERPQEIPARGGWDIAVRVKKARTPPTPWVQPPKS